MDDDEVKKGKPKWLLWGVIGIAVVVVIVLVVQFGGGGPSSASGLTVDDLSAIVTQQSTTVQGLSTWKAIATEDLANLNTKQQQILNQISGLTNPKDWTPDMNKLKADFTALQGLWGSVNQSIEKAVAGINITIPRYAMVSQMVKDDDLGGIITDIEVYGQGSYPVIITFYGLDLNGSEVKRPKGADYTTQEAFVYNYTCTKGLGSVVTTTTGDNVTLWNYDCTPEAVELVVFVTPKADYEWGDGDVIKVLIKTEGSIKFASATVGETRLTPMETEEEDWI